ncbi:MAG: DinB family protein [Thermoanaerobaculia bacterium]|nr:DinB family protein [Thermoanaerobaculia bacterium]
MTREELATAIAVLERTPATLRTLLEGLDERWVRCSEGPETWSAFDVVGHLIHGEHTDWMPRLRRILEHGDSKAFEPFDRFAQLRESRGRSLGELLDELERLRAENLEALRGLDLQEEDFARPGRHPELGPVTLGQLLATWVVHDLGHIAQVARVMAKRYGDRVGPWVEFLPVLGDRR